MIGNLQQLLFFRNIQIHVRTNEVDEECVTFDIPYRESGVGRNVWRILYDLKSEIFQRSNQGDEFLIGRTGSRFRKRLDLAPDIRFNLDAFVQFESALSLDD